MPNIDKRGTALTRTGSPWTDFTGKSLSTTAFSFSQILGAVNTSFAVKMNSLTLAVLALALGCAAQAPPNCSDCSTSPMLRFSCSQLVVERLDP